MYRTAVFNCVLLLLQWVALANSVTYYRRHNNKREDYDFVRNRAPQSFAQFEIHETHNKLPEPELNYNSDNTYDYVREKVPLEDNYDAYEEHSPAPIHKSKKLAKKPYKHAHGSRKRPNSYEKPNSYAYYTRGKTAKNNELYSYDDPLPVSYHDGDKLNDTPEFIVYEKYEKPSMLSYLGLDKFNGKHKKKYQARPVFYEKRPNYAPVYDEYNKQRNKKNKYQDTTFEQAFPVKPTAHDILNLDYPEYVKPAKINNNLEKTHKNTRQHKKKQTFLIEETKLVEISNIENINGLEGDVNGKQNKKKSKKHHGKQGQSKKLKKETKVLKEIDIGELSDKDIDNRDLELIVKIVNNILEALPESSSVSLKKAA